MAGKFHFFWSILIPLLMIGGSILITYILYKHFSKKMEDRALEMQKEGK